MLTRVLIAMDTADQRRRIKRLLGEVGGIALEARSRRDLWAQLTHLDVDLVVCGRTLLPTPPDPFIASIRELPEHPDVVVISPKEDPVERAALLTAGCMAVLYAGLAESLLADTLRAVADRRREFDLRDPRHLAATEARRSRLTDFVSESPSMQEFLAIAIRVIETQSPLLILGETGVGKERLARAIHTDGPRAAAPFVAVNCGALPEGLLETELFGHEVGAFTGATRSRRGFFELAHRGTLFLDEIGELPLHLQVKLLRVLEERTVRRVGSEQTVPVVVRIVAATNRHLESEVEAKRFRADLYYRLAVVTLVVPPLRDRREDIPMLVTSYLDHFRSQLGRGVSGIVPEALDALSRYDWPGNVRELINVIERAVLLADRDQITLADLPLGISSRNRTRREPTGLPAHVLEKPLHEARGEVVADFETAYLTGLLQRTGGRIADSAHLAGVDPRSIHTLMKRHGLRKEDFKTSERP